MFQCNYVNFDFSKTIVIEIFKMFDHDQLINYPGTLENTTLLSTMYIKLLNGYIM